MSTQGINVTHHQFTLELKALELSDTGTYACNASNQVLPGGLSAADTSSLFFLFVQSESKEMRYCISVTNCSVL